MISVHIDVDNLWNYEREYGVPLTGNNDLIYDQAMSVALDLFREYGVRATFFVIGKDLELASARRFCQRAVAEGHEIANHSWSHPPNLHRMTYAEKEREIRLTAEKIHEVTRQPVRGFRAPGYYLDREMIEILIETGHEYDTSVLPSFLNPLMGAYISMKAGKRLDKSFGRRRYALASQSVTRIESRREPARSLIEIPIDTLPILRIPWHSTFFFMLGRWYSRFCIACVRFGWRPKIFLFHAIDFVDEALVSGLNDRVPALRLSLSDRLLLAREILGALSQQECVTSHSMLEGLKGRLPASRLL